MLFLDQLDTRRYVLPGYSLSKNPVAMDSATRRFLQAHKSLVVPFEITNVAEYLFAGTDKEEWEMLEDFPRPIPPFKLSWLEWKTPKFNNSKGLGIVKRDAPFTREAVLVSSIKQTELLQLGLTWFADFPALDAVFIGPVLQFCVDLHNGECVAMPGAPEKKIRYSVEGATEDPATRIEAETHYRASLVGSFPAMLALSFLNCKNARSQIVRVPAELVRSHARKGRSVISEYRIIEIEPVKKALSEESGQPGYSRQAAAIIRGHFKDYREGVGLFGRVHGMFWWEQRVTTPIQRDFHYELKKAQGSLDKDWKAPQP